MAVMSSMQLSVVGYVLFLTLLFLDIFITDKLLRLGGIEFNPLARFLYGRFGIKGLFGLKLSVAALITALFVQGHLDLFVIWFAVVFYLFAVILMLFETRKQKKINEQKQS